MSTPGQSNGAALRSVDCVVAVEDARVFNHGTAYMAHALPAYVRPFLTCLRGLAGPGAAVAYTALTFNREPDGRDFGQLTKQPLNSEEALLRRLAEVRFMRYPDPARAERIPVGHMARLLSEGGNSAGADRHLLLIIHSRLEDSLDQLRSALQPLTSLTIISPRQNDQLTELFSLVNGVADLGNSGTPAHPKWELVLVPRCIRFSPPPAPPPPMPAQLLPAQLMPSDPQPPPTASSVPGRLVWSGRLQFSKPDLCPVTTVQFVQLGVWSADWSFRCFDQPLPCATCALLKPEIAQAIELLPQGVGRDRLLVRLAAEAEVSPLLKLFESANSGPPQVALIFCDLKAPKLVGAAQQARCLVARYDAQLGGIVATIPADQEKFLRDMQTRFQQKQQQQAPLRSQVIQPRPLQQQPHVMVYMPPAHTADQHQHQLQPQYQQHRHQMPLQTQPGKFLPVSVAPNSVYATHPMQPPTMIINPVHAISSMGSTATVSVGGPPPAKISRIVDAASFQHAPTGTPAMRIISNGAGQPQPHVLNAPVTIQRLTLPAAAYQQQQQMQIQQQQQLQQHQHHINQQSQLM